MNSMIIYTFFIIFKLFILSLQFRSVVWLQSRGKRDDVPEVNTVSEFHASSKQEEKGKVYDKQPFKFMCEKGKSYMWCACGHSKTQVIY